MRSGVCEKYKKSIFKYVDNIFSKNVLTLFLSIELWFFESNSLFLSDFIPEFCVGFRIILGMKDWHINFIFSTPQLYFYWVSSQFV